VQSERKHAIGDALTPEPDSSPIEVSVIVPFRDAAPYLEDHLEALAGQQLTATWEVIAVDNRSRDNSRRIAEQYLGQMNLRIVDAQERLGAGYARNVGARHASGRKLNFLDADDAIAPGYLAAMASALDEHDFVTSAFDHRTLNPDWVQEAHGPLWRDPEDPLPPLFGLLPFAGGSVGVLRKTFDSVGGYPEEFERAQDIAFSWNVQLGGTELYHVPEAVYRVRYRASLTDLYCQAFAWGCSLPLLYRTYRTKGMRRRPLRITIKMGIQVTLALARARSRADLAQVSVRAGLLLGRIRGSISHRILFP
jgi:glycosyltransferase involved in cell wall biosynthesis